MGVGDGLLAHGHMEQQVQVATCCTEMYSGALERIGERRPLLVGASAYVHDVVQSKWVDTYLQPVQLSPSGPVAQHPSGPCLESMGAMMPGVTSHSRNG